MSAMHLYLLGTTMQSWGAIVVAPRWSGATELSRFGGPTAKFWCENRWIKFVGFPRVEELQEGVVSF